MGDTPVPIPNTTVKTHTADGTSLETVRESRWPPEQKEKFGAAGRAARDWRCRKRRMLRDTHLENRIYDNLAECIKFERMRCTRRIGYAGIPKERPDGCDEMGVSA